MIWEGVSLKKVEEGEEKMDGMVARGNWLSACFAVMNPKKKME